MTADDTPEVKRSVREQNLQAEVDRLRILLQKVTAREKDPKRGLMMEVEPGTHGFRVIATGFSEKDEWRVAQQMADWMNILMKGALRWSLKSLDTYQCSEELEGTIQALATPLEEPVPEATQSVDGIVAKDGSQ